MPITCFINRVTVIYTRIQPNSFKGSRGFTRSTRKEYFLHVASLKTCLEREHKTLCWFYLPPWPACRSGRISVISTQMKTKHQIFVFLERVKPGLDGSGTLRLSQWNQLWLKACACFSLLTENSLWTCEFAFRLLILCTFKHDWCSFLIFLKRNWCRSVEAYSVFS